MQQFVDLRQAGAQLFRLELQQPFASLGCIALGFEILGLLRELRVLGFALEFLGSCSLDLRCQRMNALTHFGEERLDTL